MKFFDIHLITSYAVGVRLYGITILWTILFGMVSQGLADDNKKTEEINWIDFSGALALGEKENKVTVVDFYTDWCGWCKVMDKKTYGNTDVIKYANNKMIMSKVNAESSTIIDYKNRKLSYKQLAKLFRIRGYPATIFIDPAGEYITTVPGFISPEKFIPMMEFLGEGHYKNMKYDEFLAKRQVKPSKD